jgi:two-component system chemotaxis response regulator CheY
MEKILIVDNSMVIRKVISKLLQNTNLKGAEVFQAENGEQALELVEEHGFELIFLDLNMPLMNGFEFLENFSSHERYDQTKVVVVTTEGSDERKKELEDLGVEDRILKPIKPEQFEKTIEALGKS